MSGNEDIFKEAYEKVRINIETIERIKRENTFMGIKNYENKKEFIYEMKSLVYNTYNIMKTISRQHFKQNPNVFDQDSIIQSNVHVQNPIHDTIYTLFKMFPDNFNEIIQSTIIDVFHKRKPNMDFYYIMLVYLIFFLESFQLEQKLFYMEFVCNTFKSASTISPNLNFTIYHLYATKHNIIKKELEQTGYNTTKLDCMIPFNNTLDSTSISEEEAVRLGATPEPKDKRTKHQKRKALEEQNDRNKRYKETLPSRTIPNSYNEYRNRVNDEIMALLRDVPNELGADFFNMQPRGGKPKRRRKTRRTKKKSKKTKKRTTKYK